ncbi:putative membrane protein (plasmid) [Bacillus thuringiensis serovar kurstaki]|jgi:hypothetical protein|nr:putative membrane protein [Bacillus thuringiensis serovar kurstaki]
MTGNFLVDSFILIASVGYLSCILYKLIINISEDEHE